MEWADRLFLETYTQLGDFKPAELAGGGLAGWLAMFSAFHLS
jgi:hypothetical protein